MRAKGSVTIFLSLALILVIALVGSLLESARVTVSKEIALDNSYLAAQNILAEYQRELWNDYHIFFVDVAELKGTEGSVKLGNFYLSKMMRGEYGDYIGATADFTKMGFNENITENNCYYFTKQAVAYMKYAAAGKLGKQMLNKANILKTTENSADAVKKGLKAKIEAEKKLIELERKKKKLEENAEKIQIKPMSKSEAKKKYKEYQKNLDNVTNEGRAGGLLGLFLPQGKMVSKLSIKHTSWNKVETMEKEKTDFIDTGLLILYAKEHFNNFLSETKENKKRDALKYGIEYLIAGKDSDEANLSSIVNRIFAIRTLVWYGYFLSRHDKVLEAETMAAAIAGVLALPAAIEIIKTGILMGWSMDEAGREVKTLLRGEEIPLFPGKSESIKLKYGSFLDSFLLTVISVLPTRIVKLIEQNMKVRYYDGFRADNMFAGITGEVRIKVMPKILRLNMLDGIVQKNFSHWESFVNISQSLCR